MAKTQHNDSYEGLKRTDTPNPLSYDIITGSSAMFKLFKERNPQINIDSKKYKEIIEEINLYYISHILNTGNMVFLPNGLGKMIIQKNKRSFKPSKDGKSKYLNAPINWPESYKQGKIIYYLNENTDGYTYRYYWLKSASYLEKQSIWVMAMTKEAKRLLKERIESNERDYKNLYKELPSKKRTIMIQKFNKEK
jgi:hypothetical protein